MTIWIGKKNHNPYSTQYNYKKKKLGDDNMDYYLIFQENNEGILTYCLTTDYQIAYLTFKQKVLEVLKESSKEYKKINNAFTEYETYYSANSEIKVSSDQCSLNLNLNNALFNIIDNLTIFIKPFDAEVNTDDYLIISSTYKNQKPTGNITVDAGYKEYMNDEIRYDIEALLSENTEEIIESLCKELDDNENGKYNNEISLIQTQKENYKQIVLTTNKIQVRYYIQPLNNIRPLNNI